MWSQGFTIHAIAQTLEVPFPMIDEYITNELLSDYPSVDGKAALDMWTSKHQDLLDEGEARQRRMDAECGWEDEDE